MLDKIKQLFATKSHAYQRTFHGPLGEKVLKDLARYCRAAETTFHADPRLHAVAEGRREVWLHINRYLLLTPEQIYALRFEELAPTKESTDQ